MPKTLISSEEMAGTLIAYAKQRGSMPEDAVIKKLLLVYLSDNDHFASIEWEPAKRESGSGP